MANAKQTTNNEQEEFAKKNKSKMLARLEEAAWRYSYFYILFLFFFFGVAFLILFCIGLESQGNMSRLGMAIWVSQLIFGFFKQTHTHTYIYTRI